MSERSRALGEFALGSFRLTRLLLAVGDELGRDMDMSSARWQVLGTLVMAGQPLTVADIGRRMGQSRQSVQRVADWLAEAGLIDFRDNPRHQRAKLAVVTESGRRVREELETRRSAWADDLFADLDLAELSLATQVLDKITARLSSPS